MHAAIHPRRTLIVLSALASALVCPIPALAQMDSPSFEDELEEAERLAPREPGEIEAFDPEQEDTTEAIRPGLTEGLDWLGTVDAAWMEGDNAGLLPERSFVNGVRGRVVHGPHGMLIFVPVRDVSAPRELPEATDVGSETAAEPAAESGGEDPADGVLAKTAPELSQPVLLLPCGELDRFAEFVLDDAAEQNAAGTEALLTGQVFLYDGRNYVLPTLLQRAHPGLFTGAATAEHSPSEDGADAADTGSQPTSAEGDASPSPQPDAELEDDPDVEALIADLEREPPYSPTARRAPSAETDQRSAGRRRIPAGEDGEYHAAQRGRLERASDGTWSFVIDTDRPDPDAPVQYTLLPCRALYSIESLALRQGDSAAGVLSGRVYRFRDGLYMLPTLFQREHREGVDPLQ